MKQSRIQPNTVTSVYISFIYLLSNHVFTHLLILASILITIQCIPSEIMNFKGIHLPVTVKNVTAFPLYQNISLEKIFSRFQEWEKENLQPTTLLSYFWQVCQYLTITTIVNFILIIILIVITRRVFRCFKCVVQPCIPRCLKTIAPCVPMQTHEQIALELYRLFGSKVKQSDQINEAAMDAELRNLMAKDPAEPMPTPIPDGGEETGGDEIHRFGVFNKASLKVGSTTTAPFETSKCNVTTEDTADDLATFVEMTSFSWTTTNTVNQVLKAMVMPIEVTTLKRIRDLLKIHRFNRFDIELAIVGTGSPYNVGSIIACIAPICDVSGAGPSPTQQLTPNALGANGLSLPHVRISAATDTIAKLIIPWSSALDYDSPGEFYANVHCYVELPLRAGTGQPTTMDFIVYARIFNVSSSVLREAQGLIDVNVLSNHIDAMNNSSLPTHIAGDSVSLNATLPFGLGAPSDPRKHPKMMMRMYEKTMGSSAGYDVDRMSFSGSDFCGLTKCDADADDEMSFSYFRNKYFSTPFGYGFTYANTTPKGTQLISKAIPDLSQQDIPLIPANIPLPISLMQLARFWRGSWKVCVVMGTNAYTKGKIFIGVHYGLTPADLPPIITTSTIDAVTAPGVIIDVSKVTTNCVEVVIPYQSYTPYSNTLYRTPYMINSVKQTDLTPQHVTLSVYALTPLRSASGAPTTVDMKVYLAWGDDFELFYPGNRTLHFLAEGDNNQLHVVGPINRPYELQFDLLKSLKQFLNKPNHLTTIKYVGGGENFGIVDLSTALDSGIGDLLNTLYAGWRGSMRVHVRYISANSGNWPIELHVVDSHRATANKNSASLYYNTMINHTSVVGDYPYIPTKPPLVGPNYYQTTIIDNYHRTAVIEAPYSFTQHFMPTGALGLSLVWSMRADPLMLTTVGPSQTMFAFDVSTSFGDDFRFLRYSPTATSSHESYYQGPGPAPNKFGQVASTSVQMYPV